MREAAERMRDCADSGELLLSIGRTQWETSHRSVKNSGQPLQGRLHRLAMLKMAKGGAWRPPWASRAPAGSRGLPEDDAREEGRLRGQPQTDVEHLGEEDPQAPVQPDGLRH